MFSEKKFGKWGISIFLSLILAITLLLPVSKVVGAEYPDRPVNIVIPFGPGGVSSILWRAIGETMTKSMGEPVVLMNKPGGGTTLAWTYLSRAKPDGYTTGGCPISMLTNTYLAHKVGYHPLKSFTFIGGIWQPQQIFVVKSDAKWKTWQEFFDYAKANPTKLKLGYANPTSMGPTTMKWIAKTKNLTWQNVHFNGEAECITALLGGHIDGFVGSGVVHTLLKDGRARPLLALTQGKAAGMPEVPTVYELYKKNTFQVVGMIAPAGIPEHVAVKLEKDLHQATKDPLYKKAVEKMGAIVYWRNRKEFAEDVKNIYETQKDVLRTIGMLRKDFEE